MPSTCYDNSLVVRLANARLELLAREDIGNRKLHTLTLMPVE